MRKTILNAALIVLFSSLISANIRAQTQAKKYDNPKWKSITFIQFKEGKMDRVREIIDNYFVKAAEKSGTPTPSMVSELVTGEWNMVVVWDMKEGVDALNWETSPDDVKWMTAMNEIAGTDKAKAILDEWSSLIVRTNSYLGR
jgi:hypothetical protein